MEKVEAKVECRDDKHFIRIGDEGSEIVIPISEDKPKAVKTAFNRIIRRLKSGEFQIELDEVREDLFSQVANEYLKQLNREIREIHRQMKEYGLVSS